VRASEIVTPGGGLIIFQGMQDHTAESIKSLEGFDIAWVEEAQTLSEKSLELLRPTIRKPGSEIWFTWNPRDASDAVDRFLCGDRPPEGAVIVTANWSDNPLFPASRSPWAPFGRAR
jgi:phage terminase large subunit